MNLFPTFLASFATILIFYIIIDSHNAYSLDNVIYSTEYKQGQIDAINGVIHYELLTMPDSTKEWRLIRKDDNE